MAGEWVEVPTRRLLSSGRRSESPQSPPQKEPPAKTKAPQSSYPAPAFYPPPSYGGYYGSRYHREEPPPVRHSAEASLLYDPSPRHKPSNQPKRTGSRNRQHLVSTQPTGTNRDVEFTFCDRLQQDLVETDFMATCEILHRRLSAINQYLNQGSKEAEPMTTLKQLQNKEVSISVFGRHNTGKSTLLNALAGGRFLPVKNLSETSFKVKIFHDEKVHQPQCQMESQVKERTDPCCRFSRQMPQVRCPRLREVHDGGTVKVIYGEKSIYSHLQMLNSDVRRKAQAADTLPEFELHVNAPVLSGVPPGWRVCLVDNPGFGEAKQHVEQLAERAMKISSAYVYLLTTKSVGDKVDDEAFRNLAERDREAFTDGRFVAAVTHFDENYSSMMSLMGDEDESANECEVKGLVSGAISAATSTEDGAQTPISFDEGSVIPISGSWALIARLLETSWDRDNPEYKRKLRFAIEALRKYPHDLNYQQGQGESLEDCLKYNPDKASALLYDASGVHELQKKIEAMTASCVKVWARKVSSDYNTFLRDAKDGLCSKRSDVKGKKDAKLTSYKSDLELYKSIESDMKALKLPAKPEDSPVWQAIDAAYPTDIENSNLKEIGERTVRKLVEEFKQQIKAKIKLKKLTHDLYQESLSAFLKQASQELDQAFNSACAFGGTNEALRDHSMNMIRDVETIRSQAHELLKSSRLSTKRHARDRRLRSETQAFEAPNLGKVKEEIKIPSVSFSILDNVKMFFKKLFSRRDQTVQEKLKTEIDKKQATLQYRSWTKEHDEIMSLLQQNLEVLCTSYFEDIRPNTVKYFFSKYKEDMEEELRELSPFKTQIKTKKERLDQMYVEIGRQEREISALEETLQHLAILEHRLNTKTEEYTRSLSTASTDYAL